MGWFTGDRQQRARAQAEHHNARGLRLAAAGRQQQALKAFESAVALAPSLLDARVNCGSMLYRLALNEAGEARTQRLNEAARHFRYVLGLDPTNAAATLDLAAACNALGELDESLRLLQSLAHSHPQHRDVHYNLAVAYLHRGQREEARQAALQELAHHPDHQQATRLLAEVGREGE